jgi:hypothetical protein
VVTDAVAQTRRGAQVRRWRDIRPSRPRGCDSHEVVYGMRGGPFLQAVAGRPAFPLQTFENARPCFRAEPGTLHVSAHFRFNCIALDAVRSWSRFGAESRACGAGRRRLTCRCEARCTRRAVGLFDENGIAKLMCPKGLRVQLDVQAIECFRVGKSAQQFVTTGPRFMGARQNSIHDAQLAGCRDFLSRHPFALSRFTVKHRGRMFQRPHNAGADCNDAVAAHARPGYQPRRRRGNAVRLIKWQKRVKCSPVDERPAAWGLCRVRDFYLSTANCGR